MIVTLTTETVVAAINTAVAVGVVCLSTVVVSVSSIATLM